MNGQNPNNLENNNQMGSTVLGQAPNVGMANGNPGMAGGVAPIPPANPSVNPTPVSPVNPIPVNPTPVAPTPTPAGPIPTNPGQVNPTPVPASGESSGYTATANTQGPTFLNQPGEVPTEPSVTPNNVNPTPMPSNPINNTDASLGGTNVGIDPIDGANVNGFAQAKKEENIGMTPPAQETKKGMNKTLFVVLIIVLIAGVAAGIYFVLNMSKNKVNNDIKINLKFNPINYEYGADIDTSVSFYANIEGTDATNCVLNLNNVDKETPGSYEYEIVCGSEPNSVREKGVIIINEPPVTEGPTIALKPVYRVITDTQELNVNDFVVSCMANDEECSEINFVSEDTVNQNILNAGYYEVEIEAKDAKGNTTNVTAPLYVLDKAILINYNCETTEETLSDYNATKKVNDNLAIGQSDNGPAYLNVGRRSYIYKFNDEEEYNEVVGNHPAKLEFDGNEGLAIYDDENLTLEISVNLGIDLLNSEAGGTFGSSYTEIQNFYKAQNRSCSFGS